MMNKIESYKDLEIWKLAIEQCVDVYKATQSFPKDELYGLVSQIRRAATSISANIAEGYSRRYDKERSYFISNALASNAELESHLIVSQRLGYLQSSNMKELLDSNEILGRSLTNFYKSLSR